MIVLNGIELDNSLYLDGVRIDTPVAVQQQRDLQGNSIVRVIPVSGGRTLTIGTTNARGKTMGFWTQDVIDQLRNSIGSAVNLCYRGENFTVRLVEFDFSPFHSWEFENPDKKYTGSIKLLEVE